MTRLIGLSGSLRQGSINTALLRAAAELMPAGSQLSVHTVRGIPLYDGDVEAADGIPPAVDDLKQAIAGSAGLILATPEYNNGVPGVFKNAIDWLSRPAADIQKVFGGRPVALIGATPGGFGTVLAQDHWLSTLRSLGTRPWFGGRLTVARAHKVFDDAGGLTDETVRAQLREFLRSFVQSIEAV